MQITQDYDCNAGIFISYVRDEYSVNILRILKCEGSIRGNLMCALEMFENDLYVFNLIKGINSMDDEVQSYDFHELIKFVIIVCNFTYF